MGRRFSTLKKALKYNDGQAAAGSALEKYKKVATGEVKPNYTRSEDSNPGSLVLIYLSPFAGAVGALYEAYISKRVNDSLGTLADTPATLFNHLAAPTGQETAIDNPFYIPAKAIIGTSGTGTTNETSKITGLPYKKETNAKSYTVPFGSKKARTATDTLLALIGDIKTAVKAKSAESTVSFQPEQFKG